MIQYPWLNTIYNQILFSYDIKKGHHALLLYSTQNNGEDILINSIARWLICKNSFKIKYCNSCSDCYLMNIGQHPDYYQLDLKYQAQSIGVDSIRDCIDSIYRFTQYSKSKIVFIQYIEYLTDEAVNMLLKILEEPPDNTYFFFRSRKIINIPLTLLSRCVKWVVTPPVESLGIEWLINNQKLDNILFLTTALRLNYGSPIEAKVMLQSDQWKARVELCNHINDVIKNGNFLQLLPILKNKEHRYIFISWLITLLVDALKYRQGVKEKFFINLDQLQLILNISVYWKVLSLHNQLSQWIILFYYFQRFDNINHELLLTCRLLNWQQGTIESCIQ
ncbi:DNA polymerase III, delta prime subunit [Candidatus Blochmanniella floridana]|uniref:DNA polymerase III subunit delta' n=1 Tax=Blochmanniella floridana TaxID=203907 RepID=Q7VR24_BLOFL|nr:DNA polymerase III, delta prime subunit [Candidatus Blochmannia floridanus]